MKGYDEGASCRCGVFRGKGLASGDVGKVARTKTSLDFRPILSTDEAQTLNNFIAIDKINFR
jgi:hypothetical protein